HTTHTTHTTHARTHARTHLYPLHLFECTFVHSTKYVTNWPCVCVCLYVCVYCTYVCVCVFALALLCSCRPLRWTVSGSYRAPSWCQWISRTCPSAGQHEPNAP